MYIIGIVILFSCFSLYILNKLHKRYTTIYLVYLDKYASRSHIMKQSLQIIKKVCKEDDLRASLLLLITKDKSVNGLLYKMFKKYILDLKQGDDIDNLRKYKYKKLVLLCNNDKQVEQVANIFKGEEFFYITLLDKTMRQRRQ